MDLEYNSWFFVAVILGVEYGLKEYFELLPERILKRKSSYWFFRCTYWLILILLLRLFFTASCPWFIWPIVAMGATLLGSLELVAFFIEDKLHKITGRKSYLLQFLLFITISWAAYLTAKIIHYRPAKVLSFFCNWLRLHQGNGGSFTNAKILAVGTVALLLAYPVNYIIRWLIGKSNDETLPELISHRKQNWKKESDYLSEDEQSSQQEPISQGLETIRAGRVIGILERWLIMILILCGQAAGIGFVLTAKSIARFKNFDEDHFAEYYLMGTLYSAVFAILLSIILINLR